ncbi:hypothetical protein OG203_03640 [Nocardia sp. NBC_01499]|uniref:hypothetical protein n=1 Tax=Nocardia sp. NBC_01499 TaxID=2903597 RepID=UPI0038696564
MSTNTSSRDRTERDTYPLARTVLISAWAVPVLIIGQFAMVAIVPVALVVIGTLRDARLRPLRWWAGALAVAYAVPLTIWASRSDPAKSLSKDMNPVLAAIVVVTGVTVAVVHHILRRRSRSNATMDQRLESRP